MTAASRLAQHLIQAANKLHARKLWLELEDDDAIALDIPDHDKTLAACVMGQSGEEFGLTLFRDGLAGMQRFFEGGFDVDNAESVDQMSLLVSPLHEVPPPLRGLLEEAGWRGRRETLAPHMIVKRPGKHARGPRKAEIRAMLHAVSAILAADEAAELKPSWYGAPEGVQLLRLSGAPHAPKYELDIEVLAPAAEPPVQVPLELAPADYRVADGAWGVGLFAMNAGIEGDDRTVSALMVADCASGRVIHHDVVLGRALEEAAVSLFGFIELERELPSEMLVLNRGLAELVQPALAAHGVACRHEPDQPELKKIASTLSQSLEVGEEEPIESRNAHDELGAAMAEVARRHPPNFKRPLARYFGSTRRGEELIRQADEPDELAVPLSTWHFTCYRAQSNSKTILERALARRDLSPGTRAVGEAMRDAQPTLYRIESMNAPFLELLDLVTGAKVRVRDVAMSSSGQEGVVVPAIVYRAGEFLSISMIGPALAPMRASRAFDYLESVGIAVTPEGLRRDSHFGGRLAEWARREPMRMPQMCNSDGHVLLMHTGDFIADNPRAAAKALDAHADLDYDEREGTFAWLGVTGGIHGDGNLLLGRIEVLDDHLVLECNSAERFEDGRALLEAIPGVRFEAVRTRAFDPRAPDEGVPADDLPGIKEHRGDGAGEGILDQSNLPPEIVELMFAQFAEFQMTWLDTEIPMFGGKTPRELCATPEGRNRVRFEIRSIPTPHPSFAGERMERIRARLFRELGIDPEV